MCQSSLEVLRSSLAFLREALLTDPASCEGIFCGPSEDVSHLVKQAQDPGPKEVAKLMVMWLSSAPRILLPLQAQVKVVSASNAASLKRLQVMMNEG